jgi:hypothetical protein
VQITTRSHERHGDDFQGHLVLFPVFWGLLLYSCCIGAADCCQHKVVGFGIGERADRRIEECIASSHLGAKLPKKQRIKVERNSGVDLMNSRYIKAILAPSWHPDCRNYYLKFTIITSSSKCISILSSVRLLP